MPKEHPKPSYVLPYSFLVGFMLLSSLACLVLTRYTYVNLGYKFSKLVDEKKKLQGENDMLRAELLKLKSLERLEECAKDLKLNLKRPEPHQILIIEDRDGSKD